MPRRRHSLGNDPLPTTKVTVVDDDDIVADESREWMKDASLTVLVLGAGDGVLAKTKTYPALFCLFQDGSIPRDELTIFGLSKTKYNLDEFRSMIRSNLASNNEATVDCFLERCYYKSCPDYGDLQSYQDLVEEIETIEKSFETTKYHHRLFYFAVPPDVYSKAGMAISVTAMQEEKLGFSRLIVEKPFGRDSESFEKINKTLSKHFVERDLYRIDHYLGKEMVQNVAILRFANRWLEKIWNRTNIQCVMLTFKDKGGVNNPEYFDKYGIIRDIIQNHLFQLMCLVAMEAPTTLNDSEESVKAVRDAKIAVLNAIENIEDYFLGQYEGYGSDVRQNPYSTTPTFCVLKLEINTPRWAGVPFILKAGKGMDNDKDEIRVQFKDSPGGATMFHTDSHIPRNEFVISMRPKEAAYFKTNVKRPGFSAKPIQSELEINYDTNVYVRDAAVNNDPYVRLLSDVCRGRQAHFVRDDELRRSWELLTPLLQKIENEKPVSYPRGSRGPPRADDFIKEKAGYLRNPDYVWYDESTLRLRDQHDEDPILEEETIPENELCDVGLYGLAVMGQNFALNMASHGFKVCVGNRSPEKVAVAVRRAKDENDLPLIGSSSPKQFVSRIKKPRKIIVLVQAGKPVDDTIASLSKYMDPQDVLVDGGNEWYPNSIRRAQLLEHQGIRFVGMGISGGEEGARNGPSLMPGGPKEAYDLIEPILTKCAAQVPGVGPCAAYLGPIGSGNYVKMVHNGIEYGDMQLIAEVYDILKNICEMSNAESAALFEKWNKRELESYLIEITSTILKKDDDQTKSGQVVDYVLDKTGMKGTGKWTIQEAAEKSVAAPTMAASLDTRFLSARKDERLHASEILAAPLMDDVDVPQVVEDLRAALYCAKICSYAQGLSLIKTASDERGWDLDLRTCARLWMGGCIIRAASLLDKIQKAFAKNPNLHNLLVDPSFAADLNVRSRAWRRVVALAIKYGVACPSLASSLTYFDQYRRARLPANLTQAQRDFFGGHTYERVDIPGKRFHTAWTEAHKDIGDADKRTAGEKL